jgi:hypothetical protein
MYKKVINDVVSSIIRAQYQVKELGLPKKGMDRLLFIKNIELLQKLENKRTVLEESVGIDMSMYDDDFYQVIENMYRMVFNDDQIELIKCYLYELLPDPDYDGKIDMDWDVYPQSPNTGQQQVTFASASDVWFIIQQLSSE